MVEKEERMAVVRWYDNKSVTLISSYCAVEPQDKVQSWSKSNRAFVEVSRPDVVKQQIHGRNWPPWCMCCKVQITHEIMCWALLMHGWSTAVSCPKATEAKELSSRACTSLILVQSQRGRPTIHGTSSPPPPPPKRVRVGVPDNVRTDKVAHWPTKCDTHGRCKFCKVQATTSLWEMLCLCFTEDRNCFHLS